MNRIKVLDHGYVEFVEAWGKGIDGDDTHIEREHSEAYVYQDTDFEVGIIEAARQSTQGSFRGWEEGKCNCSAIGLMKLPHLHSKIQHDDGCTYHPGDKRLLEFLYSHKHFTPFEFAGMVLEVQAPIFVFREWHRHRTQSYNEMSARYAPLPDLYYLPSTERLMISGGHLTSNKQAQAVSGKVGEMTVDEADAFRKALASMYNRCEYLYQTALADGVPKELARCVMPVGHYSRMRCSANLRNWLAFCTLRCDPQAQLEIRSFASVVADLLAEKFPKTYQCWIGEGCK